MHKIMGPRFQFSCLSSDAFAPFQINHPFISYLILACCSDNWQYTWAFMSKALTLYQCNNNNFYQVTSVFPAVVLLKMCFIWHLVQECLIMLNPGRLQRWSPSFFRRKAIKETVHVLYVSVDNSFLASCLHYYPI